MFLLISCFREREVEWQAAKHSLEQDARSSKAQLEAERSVIAKLQQRIEALTAQFDQCNERFEVELEGKRVAQQLLDLAEGEIVAMKTEREVAASLRELEMQELLEQQTRNAHHSEQPLSPQIQESQVEMELELTTLRKQLEVYVALDTST